MDLTTQATSMGPDGEGKEPNFGAAIRQRRKALGMTLGDVAKITKLTSSFLSQVERGLCSPSLSSFMRIAGALQTNLEQLLKVPEPYAEFVPHDGRQVYSLGEPGRIYEKLGPGFPGALNYPCIVHRPAGHISEKMQHDGEVFCYLISGKLEYHLGDKVYFMGEGDCIHHDTNKFHFSKVISDVESVELWVSSTPIKLPDSKG